MTDAFGFENSTFWDPDTTSGIGGWGDPNNDYQINSGGFANGFTVSYPSPHKPRRQYTPTFPGFPDLVTLITPESQEAIIKGSVGNFIGFQAALAAGSHAAVHLMVGGCVNLPKSLWFARSRNPCRDLFGACPSNAPASCILGQKWTPNGTPSISTHRPAYIILTFR